MIQLFLSELTEVHVFESKGTSILLCVFITVRQSKRPHSRFDCGRGRGIRLSTPSPHHGHPSSPPYYRRTAARTTSPRGSSSTATKLHAKADPVAARWRRRKRRRGGLRVLGGRDLPRWPSPPPPAVAEGPSISGGSGGGSEGRGGGASGGRGAL